MKLRIKGNTIRLRLTRTEVDYFGKNLSLEENTGFIGNAFTYSIQANNVQKMTASFDQNKLTVSLPLASALEWVNTDLIGCNSEMDLDNGKKLYLLVEKDFKCLDETIEDQSDNYENPLAQGKK